MSEATAIKKSYILNGLDCANCAEKINRNVKAIDGITDANVSFVSRELAITLAPQADAVHTEAEIKKLLKSIEPHVKMEDKKTHKENSKSNSVKVTLIRLIISIVLLAAGIVTEHFGLSFWISFGFFIASYLCAGVDVIITAFKNIARGEIFDENFLMLIATAGALVVGEYTEAAAVMLFYQTGEMFQNMAVNNSRRSIAALMDIRPDYANVRRSGELVKVSPEEVAIGEIFTVKPGERVPLDGKIISGSTSIDTSSLTGESKPRDVAAGDVVLSGTVNLNGVFEAEAQSEYGDSTVKKILELIEKAEGKKSKTESFITRFAKIYTPVVVLIGVIIGVAVPLLFGLDFYDWLYRGLVFLIISCPCALVISIPLSYFSGIGKASREGVLIKGSNYFEALYRAETVVFDKTGTLTKGSFKVTEIRTASVHYSENDILEAAAYAEYYSTHPIARAIREKYASVINESEISDYSETAGEGIYAKVGETEILAGNFRLMERHGIHCPEIEQTHVHVAMNGEYAGSIIISDELKDTSKETVKLLKKRGINKIVMLTGDNEKTAKNTARELGIDEANVYSQLLPQDKYKKLEELKKELPKDRTLVFAGDGINDAPVLALADVGAAMGGLGSDSAIEAADLVIMNDEPIKLINAMDIASRTKTVVWQNIVLALGVKLVIQVLGLFGLAGMWAAVFADVGVTLLAVINSMRLLRK